MLFHVLHYIAKLVRATMGTFLHVAGDGTGNAHQQIQNFPKRSRIQGRTASIPYPLNSKRSPFVLSCCGSVWCFLKTPAAKDLSIILPLAGAAGSTDARLR
eukprot:2949135-Amphidinium_carterae.1